MGRGGTDMPNRRQMLTMGAGLGVGAGALALFAAFPAPLAPGLDRGLQGDAHRCGVEERCTPPQYAVLRRSGTERPYSSPLNDEHRKAPSACAGCQLALVLVGDQVRQPDRLAELLGAARRRGRHRDRHDAQHEPHLGPLRPVRRPSRPCLRRRAEPDRAVLRMNGVAMTFAVAPAWAKRGISACHSYNGERRVVRPVRGDRHAVTTTRNVRCFSRMGRRQSRFSPSHSSNVGLTNLWLLDAVPTTNAGRGRVIRPRGPSRWSRRPPGNVVHYRRVPAPTKSATLRATQAEVASASMAPRGARDNAARHPGFHKAHSVDYAIVSEGEI